jgi:hypothetical protein
LIGRQAFSRNDQTFLEGKTMFTADNLEGLAIIAACAIAAEQVAHRVIFPAVNRAIDRKIENDELRSEQAAIRHWKELRPEPPRNISVLKKHAL